MSIASTQTKQKNLPFAGAGAVEHSENLPLSAGSGVAKNANLPVSASLFVSFGEALPFSIAGSVAQLSMDSSIPFTIGATITVQRNLPFAIGEKSRSSGVLLPFGISGQDRYVSYDYAIADFVLRVINAWPYFREPVKVGSTMQAWTIQYTLKTDVFGHNWKNLFGQTGYGVQNSTSISVPYIAVTNILPRWVESKTKGRYHGSCLTAIAIVVGDYDIRNCKGKIGEVCGEFDNMFCRELGAQIEPSRLLHANPQIELARCVEMRSTPQSDKNFDMNLARFMFSIESELILETR